MFLSVGSQIGVTVRLLDWAVKPDVKRDISTTEINLSARQALKARFDRKHNIEKFIKDVNEIATIDGQCLCTPLDPDVLSQLRMDENPFPLNGPHTLINSDTFTVMFSCPTIKSLHNLWQSAESGDLSDIMKSLMFGYMQNQIPLESLSLESTIDGDEYRKLQKTLQGYVVGSDTTKSIQSRYMNGQYIILTAFTNWKVNMFFMHFVLYLIQ